MTQRTTERKWKGSASAANARAADARAEDQLRILSQAVEQSPSVVIITDTAGLIEYVNPKFVAVTGYAAEEVTGKHVDHLGDLSPEEGKRLWETLTSGGEWRGEFRNRRKNGEVYWVSASISPIRSADGVITHYLGVNEDITECKQAEEALRESEGRLRSLFETMAEGVVLIAADGQIVQANPAAERILGLKRSEIEGRSYVAPEWEIFRPDGTPMPPEEMAGPRAMKERRVVKDVVMGVKRPDGSISWINVSAAPLIDEAGQLHGVVGAFADITGSRRAEEALRESEERYRRLVERSPYAIAVHSDGRFVFMNGAGLELFGAADAGDIIGRPIWDFVHPDYVEAVKERVQRTQPEGKQVDLVEEKLVRVDGQVVDVEMAAIPIVYEGKPARQVVLRDISARRRAEEALRESEERFRSAFEHAAIGMALVAPDGRILQVNRFCCETIGYSEQELTSTTWQALTHPDDREATLNHVGRVLAGESDSFQLEKRFLHKLGHALWGNVTSSLVRDRDGTPLYFVTEIEDITERKEMEEALQKTREELETKVERQLQRGDPYGLTFRELTVLHLVAAGRSDKEIAVTLGISPLTASKHIGNILDKMHVTSRTGAGVRAVKEGLLD